MSVLLKRFFIEAIDWSMHLRGQEWLIDYLPISCLLRELFLYIFWFPVSYQDQRAWFHNRSCDLGVEICFNLLLCDLFFHIGWNSILGIKDIVDLFSIKRILGWVLLLNWYTLRRGGVFIENVERLFAIHSCLRSQKRDARLFCLESFVMIVCIFFLFLTFLRLLLVGGRIKVLEGILIVFDLWPWLLTFVMQISSMLFRFRHQRFRVFRTWSYSNRNLGINFDDFPFQVTIQIILFCIWIILHVLRFTLNFLNLFFNVISFFFFRVIKRLFLLSVTPPRFFTLINIINALVINRRRLNRINMNLIDIPVIDLN